MDKREVQEIADRFDLHVLSECDVCHELAVFAFSEVVDEGNVLVCLACEEAFDVSE